MKTAVEEARTSGRRQLPTTTRQVFVARYRELLAAGHAANPPPERRPRQRGRVKQTPVRNLLERLWLGPDEVLRFLDDLTIPFDNNQAERDLRLLKVQQKVSGCFRSDRGASWSVFLDILTDQAERAGHVVVRVPARFTTQKCSRCGEYVQKSLSVRTHICPFCGLVEDRDVNAARNILQAGMHLIQPAGPPSARGPDSPP